jgi:CRP-like cAMP-binding protein
MNGTADHEATFRTLVPINRLAPEVQQQLWRVANVKAYNADQLVFARGASDDLVHYLIEGELDFFEHGRLVQRLLPRTRTALRPLADTGAKRYTARSHTACTVASWARSEFEASLDSTRLPSSVQTLAASGVVDSANGDWMGRIMDASLFQVLPNEVIQQLFGALEPIEVEADTLVIEQGSEGDYFYLIERGYLEVSRAVGASKRDIHVADLQPGDTFGEAALISGKRRDANVTALTAGRVLRLSKANFETLVAARLLRSLGAKEALALGPTLQWLDISDPETFAKAPVKNSRNVPLNGLRDYSARLARSEPYIVCGDDPALSAVGAYALAERGFNVVYLRESVVMLFASESASPRGKVIAFPRPESPSLSPVNLEVTAMDTPNQTSPASTIERIDRLYTQQEFEAALAPKLPKEAYAETQVGQSLAALIDDIDARKADIDPVPVDVGTETLHGGDFIDLREFESRTPAEQPPPAVDFDLSPRPQPAPAADSDPVDELMHDFERRVRNYVEAKLLERTADIERRYRDRVQRLQESAQGALRKRDQEFKQRYATHYAKKDQVLRDNYQKLMTLATKISQQKAQLQQARKQMEEKLKAANAIQQQVEDMRRLLGAQMGTLDATPDATPARASSG